MTRSPDPGSAVQPHAFARPLPILMYHSISAVATKRFARFAVHPDDFARQMAYLAGAGYATPTVAQASAAVLRGEPLPDRCVVLTFDDAFADFHAVAWPTLARHGLLATLYVPTAYVGQTARFLADCEEQERAILSWERLSELDAAGIEIAAHTHTHAQLDRLSPRDLSDEVTVPKQLLEERLGHEVTGFAYPFGYRTRQVRAAVSAAGYEAACVVDDLPARGPADHLLLPRLTVNAGTTQSRFERLLEARHRPVDQIATSAKRAVWLMARRYGGRQPQWHDTGG